MGDSKTIAKSVHSNQMKAAVEDVEEGEGHKRTTRSVDVDRGRVSCLIQEESDSCKCRDVFSRGAQRGSAVCTRKTTTAEICDTPNPFIRTHGEGSVPENPFWVPNQV